MLTKPLNYLVQTQGVPETKGYYNTIYSITEYCTEEVRRQKHGEVRRVDVDAMLDAWSLAQYMKDTLQPLTPPLIRELGKRVEPMVNLNGWRIGIVAIRQGDKLTPIGALAVEIQASIELLITKRHKLAPLDFYRAFLEIHPFDDGNGRVGKILLNWLNGTLNENPVFPPNDFWGEPIVNP